MIRSPNLTGSWTDKYIGIPFVEGGRDFSGCDCGGLVLLALQVEKGVIASDFNGYGKAEFRTMHGMEGLGRGIDSLMKEWIPVADPLPFDLVRYRYGRWPAHVGIYARPGKVLHVQEGQGFARIMDMKDPAWGPRFVEFRRHKELVGDAT